LALLVDPVLPAGAPVQRSKLASRLRYTVVLRMSRQGRPTASAAHPDAELMALVVLCHVDKFCEAARTAVTTTGDKEFAAHTQPMLHDWCE
jgi:hypothetical protein